MCGVNARLCIAVTELTNAGTPITDPVLGLAFQVFVLPNLMANALATAVPRQKW